MDRKRLGRICLKYPIALALCLVLGAAWHEIVGHGLVGVLCGGHITYVEVYGVQLWPTVSWVGWAGHYGSCGVEGIPSTAGGNLMTLGGALSTWCVAVAAVGLLWVRRWPRRLHAVLAWLSIWWVDLLTYTLPSWGLRRSILWGQVYSEPYVAATALGIPGPLFQGFVIVTSILLAAALAVHLLRHREGRSGSASCSGTKCI